MPYPIIPDTITVHLGRPNQEAPNVTIPFTDYIKNVASNTPHGRKVPSAPIFSPRSPLRSTVSLQNTIAAADMILT